MKHIEYDRAKAVDYARRWALARNPAYYYFGGIGGDCTNFVSQCIYAGIGVMNYTPQTGWFYRSANDRTAAWTGVEYLYRFLSGNRSVGPYGRVVSLHEVNAGDVIQLGDSDEDYYHTLFVVETAPTILVAAHSEAALNRPLDSYQFARMRCIHIEGGRAF